MTEPTTKNKDASSSGKEAPTKVKDDPGSVFDDANYNDDELLIQTGNQALPKFHMLKPPPDKVIRWVSDRARERGQLTVGWAVYTPEHLQADFEAHGTRTPITPNVVGNKIMIDLHYPVFMRMETHKALQKQEHARENAIKNRGMLDTSDPRVVVKEDVAVKQGPRWLERQGDDPSQRGA